MEAINLNLIPNGTNPVVHCSQYDEGREFRFNLFDGASVFVLDGTEDITCDIKKPDGNIVTAAVPNTEDDYIIVTTTLQMTACSGNSLGTINISKGGINLYTLNFVLYCERSPLENGIESDSAIHNLQTQIAEAVADQYDADSVVFDSVPTQGHGTGFAVTSEGVKAYVDNKPSTLVDLTDVDIDNPTDNQALVFNPVTQKWENGEVSTVGSIDDLNDVDTSGKVDGDSLRYDGNDWVAKPTTIALTQAEYNALQTKEPNTHYVITDAPNLNPTADDIEYSSGVTVADKLDTIYAPIKSSEVVSIPNGDLAVGSNWSEGCSYVKRNGLIILHLALQGLTANTRNDVYTLPTGCRPSLQIVGAGMGGQSYTAFAQATITTGGVVQVSSVDTYARIHLMYYVNE